MTIRRDHRAGFTLIECLAALAITSLVVLSTGALLREGGYFFDRGTRAVDETERFAWATDRLTRDLAGARFVPQAGEKAATAAFAGEPERLVFVTAGQLASRGEEVVEYSIQQLDESQQLVRRRASWAGPSSLLSDSDLADPVVLLRGRFAASFEYSQVGSEGALVWRNQWSGGEGLPYSVRVKLIDSGTGVDFLAAGDFIVRANAPISCASGKDDCLKKETASAAPSQQPQQQSESQ
jgi:prepilin-type N-terminal cleavage/methylation domain-containing protein